MPLVEPLFSSRVNFKFLIYFFSNLRSWLKKCCNFNPKQENGTTIRSTFDLGVYFGVFLHKNMVFQGQSSHFEVIVVVKSVTMFLPMDFSRILHEAGHHIDNKGYVQSTMSELNHNYNQPTIQGCVNLRRLTVLFQLHT